MLALVVRNGTELRPLRVDDGYDFNYQQYQWFDERELLAGDDIYVECTYNTMDREGGASFARR